MATEQNIVVASDQNKDLEANPMIYVLQAMSELDDQARTAFVTDSITTVKLAFTMMTLQKEISQFVEQKRIDYLIACLDTTPAGAAKAKLAQQAYENANADGDKQTQQWNANIQTSRTQTEQDQKNRQSVFSFLDDIMQAMRTWEGIVTGRA